MISELHTMDFPGIVENMINNNSNRQQINSIITNKIGSDELLLFGVKQ